ncbi:MAG: single-stranded-DNA-specific exonuclease RecJ [Flavobacteriaceae bacterium]|nr:single-stranded-DNA-specific exonuclease RecJ [Flavobacteriaceae bacterium]
MRWNVKEEPNPEKVISLAKTLNIDILLAKLLVLRNVETYDQAKAFFRPNLKQLHDPFLMKDMNLAVSRIEKAIINKENIMVFGDYDVDGTTAVSLVYSYLSKTHKNITTYIPDRHNEGYGISYKGIDFANDNDISLIIALDCGIKAVAKISYANDRNIDFIICDHHRPGKEIPKAMAVLNPKQEDCNYPYDELCGCGIGFKLIQAIHQKNKKEFNTLIPYLDLVAIAIAADIVPMNGENRILASFGLQVINQNPRTGIKTLIHQIKKPELTITDVVFTIAPRINAAGRMKSGIHAVELLTETDFDKAKQIAIAIELFNKNRKEFDQRITKEALKKIEDSKETTHFTTVVFQEDWHKGVIGIVASRLIEKYYRPTLVFTKSGDFLAASARSIRGFDVYKALEACSEFIEQFGGHKYAAGLTLKPKNYSKFKAKFEEVVKNSIPKELLTPEIRIDSPVFLADLTPKFNRILKQFGPFGPLNMKPIFTSSGLRDNGFGKRIGGDKAHLKLSLITGSDTKTYNAIGFNLGEKQNLTNNGSPFEIVYTVEENYWNGVTSLQLNLKDLRAE